jgi:hypothetical protein
MRYLIVFTTAVLLGSASACERQSVLAPAPSTALGGPASPASSASSVTLAEVTSGSTGTSNNYVGQSVTIEARGAFNRIRFNWFDGAGAPVAFGTLFVLDREYLGTPPGLSESTPGFIARSEAIVGGQYTFHPGVVLRGGRQYWFYTETQGAFMTSFFGSTYDGGDMYVTGMPNLPFHKAGASGPVPPPPGTFIDANFRLEAR